MMLYVGLVVFLAVLAVLVHPYLLTAFLANWWFVIGAALVVWMFASSQKSFNNRK